MRLSNEDGLEQHQKFSKLQKDISSKLSTPTPASTSGVLETRLQTHHGGGMQAHQCINIETSKMHCTSNNSETTEDSALCGARGAEMMFTTAQSTIGQRRSGGSSTLGKKKRAEMPLPPNQSRRAVTIGSGPPTEKGGKITVKTFRAESFDDEIMCSIGSLNEIKLHSPERTCSWKYSAWHMLG